MLKKILSTEDCRNCRYCCCFNREDIWETPIIFPELKKYIEENVSTPINFIEYEDDYLFSMEFKAGEQVVWCPMLSEEGCMLKDQKPYDCKIWPFRIMKRNEDICITVSPGCKTVNSLPLVTLMNFLKEGFEEFLYGEAEKHPSTIKKYEEGYPILSIKRLQINNLI